MSDSEKHESARSGRDDASGAWVQDWIRQQRELLQRATCDTPDRPDDVRPGAAPDPWIDLAAHWHRVWTGVRSLSEATAQGFAQALQQLPAVGLAREQALAWREVASAQAACLGLEAQLRAILTRVQADALTLLEQRVRERRDAGQHVGSMRELYDLWIECGERVYAQVAHDEAYCKLQGKLVNAATNLRACQQHVIEHALRQLDLPTRAELNTVHRQMRELRDRLADCEARLAVAREERRRGERP